MIYLQWVNISLGSFILKNIYMYTHIKDSKENIIHC